MINDAQAIKCSLATGESLDVTSTGSITAPAANNAVEVGVSNTTAGGINGGINNAGTIISTGSARGIEIDRGTTLNGGIVNTGTVSAQGHAIELGQSAAATLNATLTGPFADIAIYNSGTVQTASSPFGDSSAIRIARASVVNGDIVNTATGNINGMMYGININGTPLSTLNGNITNDGAISGNVYGILNDGLITGNITNNLNGTISSGTGTGSRYGIYNTGTISGDVTNSGTITGTTVGIYNSGTINNLVNNGTITSSLAAGEAGIIYATGSQGATLTNTGSIIGAAGLLIQKNTTTINNTGTISGTTGTAVSITGNNNALILGTGSTLNGNATSTGTGNTLELQGSSSEDGNFTGFNTLTLSGTAWTLAGNITTAATTVAATSILNGILTLTGTLTNSGVGGGTTVNSGATLQIGNGTTTGSTAQNIANEGTLVFNRSNTISYGGILSGSGVLNKQGSGVLSLSGQGSSQNTVDVQQGTLQFMQAGTFNTSGDYTTALGATTDIGAGNSQLQVGGVFTQQSGSALSVTVGASPDITADSAVLGGTLTVNGFNDTQPVKASDVTTQNYTLISTVNGITGNFTNNPLEVSGVDYLLHEGHLSDNGLDYDLGFRLAWTEGGQTQGTGNFTLGAGTAFDIDVALADQTSSFDSGWDGRSLTKNGAGLLVLSAVQQYSGSTILNEGTLRTDVAQAFASSEAVNVNGGILDLNGQNQTANNLSGTGGEIRLSGGAQLLLDNSSDTTYAGNLTGTGSVLKQGANSFTLTGDASYSGPTTIDAGTLNIGNGGTSGSITSDIANNAVLVFNRSDDIDYANALSGVGQLIKQGAGVLTLTGGTAQQGSVDVQAGTLTLNQVGDGLITTGNYTTQAGATTAIGLSSSTLDVGGVFTQAADSILNVTLGASPDITAATAQLDGTLIVNGFSERDQPVTASSAVSLGYIVLHTTDGIEGDFDNNPLISTNLDYLLHDGHIVNSGLDYELGFRLTWAEGGQAAGTGNFTLNEGTAFDIDIALANQTGSFDSGWDGRSLVKLGAGRLLLSAQNSYTGSTTLNEGILQFNVADSIVPSSDVIVNGGVLDLNGYNQQFNRLAGSGGEVQLNGAALTAVNATAADSSVYAGNLTGNGSFIKSGLGNLTLSGNTEWTGNTELQGGGLILDGSAGGAQLTSNIIGQSGTQLSLSNGATLTGWVDPTDVAIDTASQWNMTANSLVNNLSNNGTITFVAPTASDFKTLTVNGDYQGNNGLLVLNTNLGGDASLTDKLVVAGNTSGSTRVQINNAGGSGAQTLNGIEVVSVGGQSDGEFVQTGRIVAGAYDYTLGRGTAADNNGNWYLTSKTESNAPIERPEASGYAANLSAANKMFVTRLHDRLGETHYIDALTGEHKVTSMWIRNEGGHNRSRDNADQLQTQANRYVLQLGGDIAQWSFNELDRLHLGVMAGYANSKSRTESGSTNYSARASVDGYSTGVYGTWYANDADKSGLYVDSWAQYSWFNNTVDGQDLNTEEYKSKGVTASVESGYSVKVGENAAMNATFFIQPKAQVIWMGVKADDHREANGTQVSGEGNRNIQTLLGVKAFMNGYSAQGKGNAQVFRPFIEANWIHNTKDFGTNMDGVTVKQDGAANIAELKVGADGQINQQVSLWGDVGQQIGNKGYSDTALMLGVKYSF